MTEIFNGAKWIGAPRETLNCGGIPHYRLSVDFNALNGKCAVVVNARSRGKYFMFEADTERGRVRAFEKNDNAWSDIHHPYFKELGRDGGYEMPCGGGYRRMTLEVNKSAVTLQIDGETVINEAELIPQERPHEPYNRRLFLFGFRQRSGTALYKNLKLEALGDENTVLIDEDFKNAHTNCSALGEINSGKLTVSEGLHLINIAPTVNVRREINIAKTVKSAELKATARGFYDLFINGKKVNDTFYNPGFTDYRLRMQYQTYDVTKFLEYGSNIIGATVGNGYYSGFVGYNAMPMIYGRQPSFIASLNVTYTDGSRETFVTDGQWQFTDCGAVIYDDYLNGEIYDARRELNWRDMTAPVWEKCGVIAFTDEAIPTNGTFAEKITPVFTPETDGGARIYETITAKYIGESPKGHFVYDLGKNIVGTARIRVRGKAGAALKLRYAEMCRRDGSVYLSNLRTAFNTDIYILRGDENCEAFVPSFTSHGFRYIEITGDGDELFGNVTIETVEGLVITNTTEISGHFECSSELVNKLYENIVRAQRGNSLLVFTDCPQRNERMGWTGDAQVFARTAAYNMNIRAFMDKWLRDLRDAQLMYNRNGAVPDTAPLGGDNRAAGCAGWGDAAVIVPWEMYRAYGDVKILEENYGMMEKWMAYITRPDRRNNGVRTVGGVRVPDKSDLSREPYIQVQQSRGDHLTFDESTPFILSATAYSARSADLMSRAAAALGKAEDSKKYVDLYQKIKRAFNDAWVNDDGSIAYWGEMSKAGINETYYSEGTDNPPSQTSYALALRFGLIDGKKAENAAQYLKSAIDRADSGLTTGFLGVSHLNPALTMTGNSETTYRLLLREDHPGWLYSVKNGATTIWERWNSYIAETDTFGDVSMNSFNHYSYGAVGEWLFETVLGIAPIEAGFKKFKIAPVICRNGGLTYARGYHVSPFGKIASEWEITGGTVKLRCTVPANTTAVISFGGVTRVVGEGEYTFECEA